MTKEETFLTQTELIEKLGITKTTFDKLGLTPAKTKIHSTYKKNINLFNCQIVEELSKMPTVIEARKSLEEKRKKRKAKELEKKNIALKELLEKKTNFYNNLSDLNDKSSEETIAMICQIMFNLNRYAKECLKVEKEYIYTLKNKIIEHLYKSNFCISVEQHKQEIEDKMCFECEGVGCFDCVGTGIYKHGFDRYFLGFHFLVNDQFFYWHQPKADINFPYELSKSDIENIDKQEIKLNNINEYNLEENINTVRWFLYDYKGFVKLKTLDELRKEEMIY